MFTQSQFGVFLFGAYLAMLVDEATAALDSKTAMAITNSILEIEGLTRIIVTHRLED